jgi:capsule polysaccharide export protein KpsE/RkpR
MVFRLRKFIVYFGLVIVYFGLFLTLDYVNGSYQKFITDASTSSKCFGSLVQTSTRYIDDLVIYHMVLTNVVPVKPDKL